MTSSTLDRYRYEALPGDGGRHIRIVTIRPGSFEDDVHVSLRVEEFQVNHNVPLYEAMSYCWGPPEDAGRILMRMEEAEGGDHDGWLPCRANLISALRHLRHGSHPREMWIDAICIDQDNQVQKGPQVALMGTIYSQAASVLIWLGPAADGSDRAMELLRDWGQQVDFDIATAGLQPSPQVPTSKARLDSNMADCRMPIDCKGDDSLAVYHLFGRDWFRRLWVRQEITLAKPNVARVQCGAVIVPWKGFRNAWGALYIKNTSDDAVFKSKMNRRMDQLNGPLFQRPQTYMNWLRFEFGKAECFDPRDRIYAIRSLLANEKVRESIRPDYSKTVAQVYQDAILAELYGNTDGDLQYLSECRLHSGWNGLSWIPDWSYPDQTMARMDTKVASGSILTSPESFNLAGPGLLQVYGIVVTRVTEVCLPRSVRDIQDLLASEKRALDDPYGQGAGGGTVLDAYARALSNNRFNDNDLTSSGNRGPPLRTIRDRLLQLQNGTATVEPAVEIRVMLRMLAGRVFLRTESGLIGLGEGEGCIQPGDEVCAVFGCSSLLALRSSSSGGQYKVVSTCCLDGADHGEAVLGTLPLNIRHVWAETERPGATKQIGWAFQDALTGEVVQEDPRYISLGIDLADLRRRRESQPDTAWWLRVDLDVLKQCLAAKGISLQTFNLV